LPTAARQSSDHFSYSPRTLAQLEKRILTIESTLAKLNHPVVRTASRNRESFEKYGGGLGFGAADHAYFALTHEERQLLDDKRETALANKEYAREQRGLTKQEELENVDYWLQMGPKTVEKLLGERISERIKKQEDYEKQKTASRQRQVSYGKYSSKSGKKGVEGALYDFEKLDEWKLQNQGKIIPSDFKTILDHLSRMPSPKMNVDEWLMYDAEQNKIVVTTMQDYYKR
jgi:hypothetical protein